METLTLEGDPLVTKWELFKTLIKYKFSPIGMKRTIGSICIICGRDKAKAYMSTPLSLENIPLCWIYLQTTQTYSSSI